MHERGEAVHEDEEEDGTVGILRTVTAENCCTGSIENFSFGRQVVGIGTGEDDRTRVRKRKGKKYHEVSAHQTSSIRCFSSKVMFFTYNQGTAMSRAGVNLVDLPR